MIDAGLQRVSVDPSMYISRGLLYAQLAVPLIQAHNWH
jgi:hypothetical protein